MNIFFSSDFHYNHKNIVRGTSKWGDTKGQRVRDFDTLEEHNTTLVENINKTVKENDILYFLGDWSFGGIESIYDFRKQLHVKNIHLILGNHDHHIERNRILPNAPKRIHSVFIDGAQNLVSISAKEIFSSVQHVLNKKIGGRTMFLSHYAHRTWPKANHGHVHLYGHSHGSLPDYAIIKEEKIDLDFAIVKLTVHNYRCMDVGIDTHPEWRPYAKEEIDAIMSKRVPLDVDHHNEETN